MKIVLGVDVAGHYKATLNLAARLKFPAAHWILANSIDLTVPLSGFGMGVEAAYGAEFFAMANQMADTALSEAKQSACALDVNVETTTLAGGAASALANYADEVHADLIAVHSERKGRLSSLFLGSVTRGLAIGSKQSILITKGEVRPEGPVSAVFATDLSEYGFRALDQFIAMKPAGIERIKVVTSLHVTGSSAYEHMGEIDKDPGIVTQFQTEAQEKLTQFVQKLQAAGYTCTGEVVDAGVNETISSAMEESKADILLMGAQGHGFMHRVLLGSTSLHQVVVEPYSLLILRP